MKKKKKKNKTKQNKTINILTTFFISHKSGIKIFLKLNINQCPKDTH